MDIKVITDNSEEKIVVKRDSERVVFVQTKYYRKSGCHDYSVIILSPREANVAADFIKEANNDQERSNKSL